MRSCFGRTDKIQMILLYNTLLFISLFAGLILLPLAGAILVVFVFTLVPFVQDIVHKDHHNPPYERCEGCGNLYSEDETDTWNNHTLCSLCSKDTQSQKEYAVTTPMWMKRLWKG